MDVQKSTITIEVTLDNNKVPDQIMWTATQSTADKMQKAKAMMVSFWDGNDSAALRMDLWTKEMRVDEMADFYFQTFMTMADSFERATHQKELVHDLKHFAQDFYKKFRELHEKENKLESK